MAIAPPPPPAQAPGFEARRLLRAARQAALGTAAEEGQPFASLVTPAATAEADILLLLSELSEHTRHLRRDPRCAVLVTGEADGPNPQTAPRVTVTGIAERTTDAGAAARYLAVHPYAALYAGFGDFAVWRIRPAQALLVGGFARAVRLRRADLAPDAEAVAAIAAAEPSIIAHCNRDHPDALARIAGQPGAWRIVGVDVDGFDLGCGEVVRRISFAAPVRQADEVRAELVRLARG